MTERRIKDIRYEADAFRENCKVIRYGIVDLFSECDRMGYKLVRYPIGQEGVLGFAQIRDGDKIIFTNSSVRLAREIFSLAHEIGHLRLHMNNNFSYIDDSSTFNDYRNGSTEMEANYFAACLLMPEDKVEKYISFEMDGKKAKQWTALDIAKMMTAFQVSFDMALIRLQNLGVLNHKEKVRLDNEKKQKKVSNLLKITGGDRRLNLETHEKRIPGEYVEWVIDNYNNAVIPKETLLKAISYIDITLDDISEEVHPSNMNVNEDLDELIGGIEE